MDPLDYLEEAGPSSATEMFSNCATRNRMDIDSSASDDELDDFKALRESLKTFCPKAATQFFEQYGLVSHQINSYNDFIKNGIQPLFDSIGEVIVEPSYDPSKKRDDEDWRHATLKFGKVTLDDPKLWVGEDFLSFNSGKEFLDMLPRHARLQNMTYSSKMNVEVHLEVYKSRSRSDKFKTGVKDFVEKKTLNKYFSNVPFGKLPVMVQSDLCLMKKLKKKDCEFDQGGYFVIKGSEKTFIAQEQIYSKRLWVSKEDHTWTISYRSGSIMERVYVKLVPKLKRITGGEKILTVYFSATEVPIWILFFALGVPNDREVVKLINLDAEDCTLTNILLESIYDADKKCEAFRKGDNSTKYIQKLMKGCRFPPSESVEECIKKYLFPSLKSFSQKAQFLAYMIKCLLEAYKGRRKVDNRNDFRNKRLELAAELLERELRVHVKHMKRHMTKALQRDLHRELQSIDHYLDASIITNGLSRAFSTGAWSHPYKRIERVSGIVATLRRTNPLQAIADMRKTRQHVNYKRMVRDARYPHPSQWGKICFLSTPDGDNCGLVKNLASLGLVSTTITALEQESLLGELYQCGMENLVDNAKCLPDGKHKIFLDGDWVGTCRDSASFVAELRSKRRNMEIPHEVEIKRDEDHAEVRIFADAGRILRPLIVVENLKKIQDLKREFKFEHLLEKGIVELIGAEEEEDCITAWGWRYLFSAKKETPPVNKKKYTHCELDSSFLLGLSCGIIPFANHDDAKRVLLQSDKYSQQAIGFPTTNAEIRADTSTHSLFYPQKPLFRTMLSDNLGKLDYAELKKKMLPHPEFFNGQCAIVAVNVHHGYNQEDSLIMNRASVERGMFRSEHTRSYKSEVENSEARGKKLKSGDLVLSFGKVKKSKIGRVDSLDDDGFPFVGANLLKGDIVIGKHDTSRVDHSIKLKQTEGGMVQRVILSSNDDGKNFAVVQLRQVRSPCIGDMFSSMHGQKGVVGILESQENFPFTKEGIVPDIVINPHAFPSRQTPGQLLEAALGKGIALGGGLKYATPFSTPSVDDIMAQLHSFKFSQWGHERVYDGRTGEKVESLIFVGPTFYQRLTHMAVDKVKYRNTGPVHSLTRQPVADRKRFGGLKFGEMERDGLIAHGAAANLQERVFTLSDPSQMHICGRCKNMADVIQRGPAAGGRKIRGAYCRWCESGEDVVKVDMPHGAKLLCHELFSMGISLKFDTDDIC